MRISRGSSARSSGFGFAILWACASVAAAQSAEITNVLASSAAVLDISVAADGSTRFFSFDPSAGRVALGDVDRTRTAVIGATYGPYGGWTPRASAESHDGLTRILWTREDGSAAIWRTMPSGLFASDRYAGIPGMTAIDVAARTETHLLWSGADGASVLQTIDASGKIASQLSLAAYPGWKPLAIADGPDGLTRLLWSSADGRVGLSLISSQGVIATGRYRPVPGWIPLDIATGEDGSTFILASLQSDEASLWALWSAEGTQIVTYGRVLGGGFSALPGLAPRRIGVASDGSSRVLFQSSDGTAVELLSPIGGRGDLIPLMPSPSGTDVTGEWAGSFQTTRSEICSTSSRSAFATLYQSGSSLVGLFDAGFSTCGLGGEFRGTIIRGVVDGVLSRGSSRVASISGVASDSHIHLVAINIFLSDDIFSGTIDLDR